MIQARIHKGRVETQDSIPEEWEGQWVKIVPLTPEDPLPDLEASLVALHAMGPMEIEASEREQIAAALAELDRISMEASHTIGESQP
jgi:hypothetical protein